MVYIFLAEGFEEIEALTAVDILRRAGVAVTTVGVGGEYVTGSHNITVKADIEDKNAAPENIDMVVLPGGMPGTLNLEKSETVNLFVDKAAEADAYIAAICAAPSILGKKGLLAGKWATCYPGFEEYLKDAVIEDCDVTVCENVICGRAMGCAVDFALELVEALTDKETSDKICDSILA